MFEPRGLTNAKTKRDKKIARDCAILCSLSSTAVPVYTPSIIFLIIRNIYTHTRAYVYKLENEVYNNHQRREEKKKEIQGKRVKNIHISGGARRRRRLCASWQFTRSQLLQEYTAISGYIFFLVFFFFSFFFRLI